MSGRAGLARAVLGSATKREAAQRMGLSAAGVRARVEGAAPELLPAWRALPAGGAFSGGGARSLPPPTRTQAAADALVAWALAAAAPHPANSQRANAVPLLVAMADEAGGLCWPRGWVRSVILALEAAGCAPPSPKVLRWFRGRLAADPDEFERVDGVDAEALARLSERAYL